MTKQKDLGLNVPGVQSQQDKNQNQYDSFNDEDIYFLEKTKKA